MPKTKRLRIEEVEVTYLEKCPTDVVLRICDFLNSIDIINLSQCSKTLRFHIIDGRAKRRHYECPKKFLFIEFTGRNVYIKHMESDVPQRSGMPQVFKSFNFKEKDFLLSLTNLSITCDILLITACTLSDDIVTYFSGINFKNCLKSQGTLILDINRCSLNKEELRNFIDHLKPFSFHMSGYFDRSIQEDDFLPDCIQNVFLPADRKHTNKNNLSFKFISNIFKRWDHSSYKYERKKFENRLGCLARFAQFPLANFRYCILGWCNMETADYAELFKSNGKMYSNDFLQLRLFHLYNINLRDMKQIEVRHALEESNTWVDVCACCAPSEHRMFFISTKKENDAKTLLGSVFKFVDKPSQIYGILPYLRFND